MDPLTSSQIPTAGDALLVVDVQNDFLPGDNHTVHDGHTVSPAIIRVFEYYGYQKFKGNLENLL